MDPFMTAAVSNIAVATALAAVALAVSRLGRRPQLAHVLWMLVLIKLITPPILGVRLPKLQPESRVEATFVADRIERDYGTPAIDAGSANFDSTTQNGAPLVASQEVVAEDTLVHTPPPTANRAEMQLEPTIAASIPASDVSTLATAPPPIVDESRRQATTSWRGIVYSVWLVGAVAFAAVFISRYRKVSRLLAQHPAADPHVTEAAKRLAEQMGLARCPSVRVVEARVPPLVWGLMWRPVIILPQSLLGDLDPAQRDAVLAHELAHVLRRDHLVRWLEVIVLVPFWFNPLAWWARRELRRAEEECCDARVVCLLPESRRVYGRALLKTLEFLSPGTPAASAAASAFGRPFFKRRIEMILKREIRPKMSWAGWCGILLLAAIVVPIGARSAAVGDETTETAGAQAEEQPTKINVNSSDLELFYDQLTTLPGLTDAEANFIVEYFQGNEAEDSDNDSTLDDALAREIAERERLSGGWKVIAMARNGQPTPSEFEYYHWYFDADESKAATAWKREDGDAHQTEEVRQFRFVVNPDASPKELTIYGDNMLIQAIYRLEDDALTICFYGRSEKDRPSQFPDAEGWRNTSSLPVMEFKLAKDASIGPMQASTTRTNQTQLADEVARAREDLRHSEQLAQKGHITDAQLEADRFALAQAVDQLQQKAEREQKSVLDARITQAEEVFRATERMAQRGFVSEAELARARAELAQARAEAKHSALQREAQGQLLELDVAEAKVRLNSAERQLHAVQQLRESNAVPQREIDERVFDVELARIALQRAEIKLKLHRQQKIVQPAK